MCEALGELTNSAPTHSFACTRSSVESAFGVPLEQLFDRFDETPVASGSIAQVPLRPLPHALSLSYLL